MALSIDNTRCQGHGRCVVVNPDLFDIDDDGYGIVLDPAPGAEWAEDVATAIGSCPEQAISD
jgi:ferredoxin